MLGSSGPSMAAIDPCGPDQNAPAQLKSGAPPQDGPVVVVTDGNEREPSTTSSFRDMHSRKHFVVRFFRGPYYQLVTHRVARWVIIAFYVAVIAVFIGFATQIKVNEEEVSHRLKCLRCRTSCRPFVLIKIKCIRL
jgi:hypothetical protein